MSKNIISNTPKSEHQLITEAVNAHGIFFKIAVRNTLEQIEGVTILGEEYPVRYMEGASLDLLVEFTTTKFRYIFPIECKRAYVANKRWLFFKDSENYSKILYCFTGKALNALGSAPFTNLGVPVCIEGIQVDLQEFQKSNASTYKAASPDAIWKAAFQSCKGSLGFIKQEFVQRSQSLENPPDFIVFPLLITTAPIYICELSQGAVDVLSGNHKGEIIPKDVQWLILCHPFTPIESLGAQHLKVDLTGYISPKERGIHSKEGVFVINSSYLPQFFKQLLPELDRELCK
jgi:hypothetical protein